MSYYSCAMLENFFINFNGRIDTGRKCISMCCEPLKEIPSIAFGKSPQETIKEYQELRNRIVQESRSLGPQKASGPKKRPYSASCLNCANFKIADWPLSDGRIHYVNLSMYPAPCQCSCFYCKVHSGEDGKFDRQIHAESYDKLFETLTLADTSGLISPDARWQVSTGEIAIHPFRERIFHHVKERTVTFYTNCFLFCENIADNLGKNPKSAINLSIDAGRPETWKKIKGVDNFEAVTENLVRYFSRSARPGQITLKYIVLPGINDFYEDYYSVIEIMKILQTNHLTIARDTRKKYDVDDTERLVTATGILAAMLYKNGMKFDMFTLRPDERERTIAIAKHLLSSGEI